MNIWGADTEQVLDQARALRTGDERVTALREALDPVVASVAWTGADADAFRELWQGCSTQIQELAAKLRSEERRVGKERKFRGATHRLRVRQIELAHRHS